MKAYEYDSYVPSSGLYNGINYVMTDWCLQGWFLIGQDKEWPV